MCNYLSPQMKENSLQILIILTTFIYNVHCWPGFRKYIPNGFVVPHPCNASVTSQGVGHEILGGGGARNPFGLDFMTNGEVSPRVSLEFQ